MAWLRELMYVLFADELGDVFEDYWKIRTEVDPPRARRAQRSGATT